MTINCAIVDCKIKNILVCVEEWNIDLCEPHEPSYKLTMRLWPITIQLRWMASITNDLQMRSYMRSMTYMAIKHV